MFKEMQLILIFLVLFYLPNSESHPPSPSYPEWRSSRFIIDNRKHPLFSSKPNPTFFENRKKVTNVRTSNETFKRKYIPVVQYHRDLRAEGSILEPNFFNENSLRGKVIKIYPGVETQETTQNLNYQGKTTGNSTGVGYEPQNFIQNENIVGYDKKGSRVVTSTENQRVTVDDSEVGTWMPKANDNVLVSISSATSSGIKHPYVNQNEEPSKTNPVGESKPRVTWDPRGTWQYSNEKTEEGNQIDANEKHVYETRIETVSYHQEVTFNLPKVEDGTKESEWYNKEVDETTTYGKQEEAESTNIPNWERNYKSAEGNYEEAERNYEETERNYEEPERNYEEPEGNYEEPERNYEEPERNYEEPERNYEEPERNYEEPERNYEKPERNYEEPERSYEEPEKNYEIDDTMKVMTESSPRGRETEENQNKVGYVVEGRNFRKYRVEERTPDGFIVGEYGVLSHDDGSLRGVRYTADGTTNPQLIYETLIKFLSL